MVDDPDLDTYVGREVVDDSGTPVGTIVDVTEGEFALEPSPELDVNTWKALGWHAPDDYDTNWEDVDYERWRSGDTDVPVDYEVWPYTLPADRVTEEGRLRLD